MSKHPSLIATKLWIEEVVIGLNLCPFAAKPLRLNQVYWRVEESLEWNKMLAGVTQEMIRLNDVDAKEIATTLIVYPTQLTDFQEYLDYVVEAEQLLRVREQDGILQIASFHPQYQFAGTTPDAVENYTNRSPFPIIHLLREDSISLSLENYENPEEIPVRNIARMKELGLAYMRNWRGY